MLTTAILENGLQRPYVVRSYTVRSAITRTAELLV